MVPVLILEIQECDNSIIMCALSIFRISCNGSAQLIGNLDNQRTVSSIGRSQADSDGSAVSLIIEIPN
jgi:hypothetical protein